MSSHGRDRLWILSAAAIIALASARPYAGGWNDGGRLATIEALVDHGTFAIDNSIFVRVPPHASPYPPNRPDLAATGTLDKLRIDGRFYSDKGPVPAVLLAGCYRVIQELTGLTASQSPRTFCFVMNLLGAGVPFVVAVAAVHAFCRRQLANRASARWVVLGFTSATIAPAYAQHLNGHILLLGVGALLMATMLSLSETTSPSPLAPRRPSLLRWLWLGALAGFGYTVDLAAGPALLVPVLIWITASSWKRRSAMPLLSFGLACLPWVVSHHLIIWKIARTMGPPGAQPEYLDWPGSPFSPSNITGLWHDRSWGAKALYTIDLWVGLRGFLWYNLPTLPALLGVLGIWQRSPEKRSLLVVGIAWMLLTSLAYGLASTNYSGECLSIRWFVPLLAPAFFLVVLWLRTDESRLRELQLLTLFGTILTLAGVWSGPWTRLPLALFWMIVPTTGVAWVGCRWPLRGFSGSASKKPTSTFNIPVGQRIIRWSRSLSPRKAEVSHVPAEAHRRAVR
jgi:hypothetical protein